MFRWHERTCSRPDITIVNSLPWCDSCHKLGSLDSSIIDLYSAVSISPTTSEGNRRQLRWPQGINYIQEERFSGLDSVSHSIVGQPLDLRQATAVTPGWSTRLKGLHSLEDERTENPVQAHEDPYTIPYPVLSAKDDIRLFLLDSKKDDEVLHGNFATACVGDESLRYEAVSYTWADETGSSSRCARIYVGEYWDIIPLTQNCTNALRSIRSASWMPRCVWVDSICIDQNNEQERSAQVALMPLIYVGAAHVLVYLGPKAQNSDLAIKSISRSLERVECIHSGDEACEECQEALQRLFARPYFGRLWIVQELVLSKTFSIFCGSGSTLWSPMFSHLAKRFGTNSWAKYRDQKTATRGTDLFSLMMDTSNCLCKDPRDKAFALLGLISHWDAQPLLSDYSLTMDEISIGLAAYFIQFVGLGWHVLLLGSMSHDKKQSLPSWVPDVESSFNLDSQQKERFEAFDLDRDSAYRRRERLSGSVNETPSNFISPKRGFLLNGAPWTGAVDIKLLPPLSMTIGFESRTGVLLVTGTKLCDLQDILEPGQGKLRGQDLTLPGKSRPSSKHILPYNYLRSDIISMKKYPYRAMIHFPQMARMGDFISMAELYWLHGIDGYAILRRQRDSDTHSVLCLCDLVLRVTEEESWDPRQERGRPRRAIRRRPPIISGIAELLVRPLSQAEGGVVLQHAQRLLDRIKKFTHPSSCIPYTDFNDTKVKFVQEAAILVTCIARFLNIPRQHLKVDRDQNVRTLAESCCLAIAIFEIGRRALEKDEWLSSWRKHRLEYSPDLEYQLALRVYLYDLPFDWDDTSEIRIL